MKIYNTLTNSKEEFRPIDEDDIKIYVCGPTVYNFFHIGNARPFVVFDTLRRYLEYRGKKVNFVQNFTDVDDKIIGKAGEEGVSAGEISEKYIAEYYKDAAALNIRKATAHPKVTENMDEIIDFVRALIDRGYAYEAGGDVYFSTRAFEDYGKLSGQDIDELESGARVDVLRDLRVRRGFPDVQGCGVLVILGDVLLADLSRGHPLFPGLADDLVVHVRKVLDEGHLPAAVLEITPQRVEDHKGTRVAYVKKIVYGRTADVDLDVVLVDGPKLLLGICKRVVYLHARSPMSSPSSSSFLPKG
jgi:hypothetical protein